MLSRFYPRIIWANVPQTEKLSLILCEESGRILLRVNFRRPKCSACFDTFRNASPAPFILAVNNGHRPYLCWRRLAVIGGFFSAQPVNNSAKLIINRSAIRPPTPRPHLGELHARRSRFSAFDADHQTPRLKAVQRSAEDARRLFSLALSFISGCPPKPVSSIDDHVLCMADTVKEPFENVLLLRT